MRRQRQVIGLGHGSNLETLHQPAGLGEVGLQDGKRLLFQIGAKAVTGIDVFTRRDRHARIVPDAQHGLDIVAGHRLLDP